MMWKILTAELKDLLFVNKPLIVPWGTEGMPQGDQRNWRATVYWSKHPQKEKMRRKTLGIAWIDYRKAYDISHKGG